MEVTAKHKFTVTALNFMQTRSNAFIAIYHIIVSGYI